VEHNPIFSSSPPNHASDFMSNYYREDETEIEDSEKEEDHILECTE
jgi:hypothetical protein